MYEMSWILVALHGSPWMTGYWNGTVSMMLNCGKEKGLLVPQANQVALTGKLCYKGSKVEYLPG